MSCKLVFEISFFGKYIIPDDCASQPRPVCISFSGKILQLYFLQG